ncbi:MAG: M28 family peptidase [Saprospiraceae bacterium]
MACTFAGSGLAQPGEATNRDAEVVAALYQAALTDGRCYAWLRDLCYGVGHRLSGSAAADKAVAWSRAVMDTLGLDSVWLQPVMVPHWVRGKPEEVAVLHNGRRAGFRLNSLALGGSVGGRAKGRVVEIKSWSALDSLGKAGALKGNIAFYNRPMDAARLHTFHAYGGAVDQRVQGPSRAAKYGAVGVLVRSMGLRLDDYPHTGTLIYDSTHALIPAVAISTNDAERLSALLQQEKDVQVSMKLYCATLPDKLSYNVIGEIRGSERPDEVILVGGHLDSWDVGHGAHDDGAGCVQSMEVLRLLKRIGYRPRRTIRCVLFMNEENGLRGGTAYARLAAEHREFHPCAIESDAGGFTPRGFSFDAHEDVIADFFERVQAFAPLLQPYGLELSRGGSGADINPLKPLKGLLCGYRPDSQRYFDYHHTAADVFEAVNQRELELGSASMTALVWLLDRYF